jgi:Fe2+ or Zn2+ uptake regulation protein
MWITLDSGTTPTPPTPTEPDPYEGAHDWAKGNLAKADAAGIIPDSFKASGWRATTTRLTVVDAIVQMVEKATGKPMETIASENGWDLGVDPFTDVTGNRKLSFLQQAGVVSGTTTANGTVYRPDQTHSRREAAVLAYNIAKAFFGVSADDVRGPNPFSDVPDTWYTPYLGYAADNGIVTGNTRADGTRTFDPGGRLTNEATILLMLNAFEHFTSK